MTCRNAADRGNSIPRHLARETTERKKTVQSVERAARLLRSFSQDTPESGVAELARSTQLPNSVIYRLLVTLEKLGFVEQNPANQKYHLGRAVFEMAAVYASQDGLIREGERLIRDLVARTQHTAQIGVLDGPSHLTLLVALSPMMIRVNLRPGDRKPAYATATGKVLLAGQTDDVIKALYPGDELAALTSHTIKTMDELLKELNEIRQRGYAFNCGESIEGIMVVAAPICEFHGRVIAGLSLAWPSHLVPESEVPSLVEHVLAASKQVSSRLGSSLALY